MLVSVRTRTRAETARKAEAEALADAGAQSYLGFHLQRVNGMLSSDQARKRLIAVGRRRTARAPRRWKALAGDVPVDWALDHHEEITAAARVRIDITAHADDGRRRARATTTTRRPTSPASWSAGSPSCAASAAAPRASR